MTDEEKTNDPTAGFELIIGPADGVIENADVAVRWCVTPELVAELEQRNIKNPYIVLGTSNEDGKQEWRTVVPLGDMLAYARFYQSGKMKVFAAIINGGGTPEKIKKQTRLLMHREYGEFHWTLQYDGELSNRALNNGAYAVTSAEVTIPDGVFGKEPAGWVKWFANLWHGKNKADDQCEFRRRMILAFTLKWIPVTLWAVLYTSISLLVLAAFAGLGLTSWITNWKVAFKPFDGSWAYMIDHEEGENGDLRDSRFIPWITWNKENELKQPLWFVGVFSPTIIFVLASITFAVTFATGGDFWWYDWHHATAILTMIFAIIIGAIDLGSSIFYFLDSQDGSGKYARSSEHGKYFAGGAILDCIILSLVLLTVAPPLWVTITIWSIIGIVGIGVATGSSRIDAAIGSVGKAFDRMYTWLENLLFSKDINDYTEIRELLCPKDHENLSTDIKAIPKERRTWRLQYHALKQHVCKPMQR